MSVMISASLRALIMTLSNTGRHCCVKSWAPPNNSNELAHYDASTILPGHERMLHRVKDEMARRGA
jgi:hypothetical protein